MAKEKDMLDADPTQKPLETIAEALLEIGETLESILALMQEREDGFKARNARTAASFGDRPSYGDRKPYERKSYGSRDDASSGDDEGGERKPYARKSFGDKKPAFGAKRSYGDKPAYGEKKSFGGAKRSFGAEKKPYKPRVARDDAGAEATPRKKYKGGY